MLKRIRTYLTLLFAVCCLSLAASAQNQLPADLAEKIDKVATDTLTRTGVPSASIAIVKDGQIAYVKAYGDARLEPNTPATPQMRYSIGSISKQFTATAILLLQEQGKLSLPETRGQNSTRFFHTNGNNTIRLQ